MTADERLGLNRQVAFAIGLRPGELAEHGTLWERADGLSVEGSAGDAPEFDSPEIIKALLEAVEDLSLIKLHDRWSCLLGPPPATGRGATQFEALARAFAETAAKKL